MRRFDHVVLDVTADTVLRAKESCEIYVHMLVKQVGDVAKIVIDRGLIRDETDARAFQHFDLIVQQVFDSENNTNSSARIK